MSEKEVRALRHIRNRIVHTGRAPTVRDLQQHLSYKSPRSAADILIRLVDLGYVRRQADGRLRLVRDVESESTHARTVDVPLVGSAPCGAPLLAEENIKAMIPVSVSLAKPSARYFLLRALGDSMNLAGIEDGDLILVRQQQSAENGDRVVALIDDNATVKEFRRTKDVIALMPRSRNKEHRPIILTSDFQIQGVVTATLPNWTE